MKDKPVALQNLWANLETLKEEVEGNPEKDHYAADLRLLGMLFVMSDLVMVEYRSEVYDWVEQFVDAWENIEKRYG